MLLPLVFLIGGKINFARHLMFRTVSQIEIEYEDSDLSEGKAGHVEAGDRLPWAIDLDNFAPLSSLDWQVHVYGEASELQRKSCTDLKLPMHVFRWTEGADHAGFKQGALYLVRPDGYVAFASPDENPESLKSIRSRCRLCE